jgi:membrane protease YdiL (CAAX protease family)
MNKTTTIVYWTTTGLIALSFLYGGYSEISRDTASLELMAYLQYPAYLLTILGVAKILAVIGILQRFSPTLREWAYAGITIDIVGAIASMIAVGSEFMMIIPAVISLLVVAISYFTMRKKMSLQNSSLV